MSNIKKIQDMVSGKYRERVSIGYEGKTTNQRKEGEEWTDARGRSWTIKDGKRKQSLALKLDKKVANAISKESHR